MKILVVAPTPFFSDRGTHIRILEEALALEKLGHEITIATYHIGKDINKEIKTKIDVRRILRLLFWYKKLEAGPDWQKIILDLMLIRKVFFLARTKKPDIIHGHLHEGILIGWIVKKILFWRHIKLVSDFHGSLTQEMVSHGYLKMGLKPIFSFLEKIINKMGDYAVTSSWEMTKELQKSRKDANVATLLDGTNSDSFLIDKTKEEIRKEMELPQEKTIVVYTGGLVPNKGINYLFDAMKIVLEKRTDIFFLIGGYPAEHIEKFMQENNLPQENIRLTVPVNFFDLPQFILAGDIAIDPKDSDAKQASGKVLNYMSAGIPIICLDKPNNREYLGKGGHYYKNSSGKDIAETIFYLADNPNERLEKGAMNKKKALDFSWDRAGKQLEKIYNQIINQSKK
jgi:glycosyltransferase involved in cell wall biosynthesis